MAVVFKMNSILQRAANALEDSSLLFQVRFELKHLNRAKVAVKELKSFSSFIYAKEYTTALFRNKDDALKFEETLLEVNAIQIDFNVLDEPELLKLCNVLNVKLLSFKSNEKFTRANLNSVPKALLFSNGLLKNNHSKVLTFNWVLKKNCSRCSIHGHEMARCPLNNHEVSVLKQLISENKIIRKDYSSYKKNKNKSSKKYQKKINIDLSNASPSNIVTFAETNFFSNIDEDLVEEEVKVNYEPQNIENFEDVEESLKLKSRANSLISSEKHEIELNEETLEKKDLSPKPSSSLKPPLNIPLRKNSKKQTYTAEYVDDIVVSGKNLFFHVKYVGYTSDLDDGQYLSKSDFPDSTTLAKLLILGHRKLNLDLESIKDETLRKLIKKEDPNIFK